MILNWLLTVDLRHQNSQFFIENEQENPVEELKEAIDAIVIVVKKKTFSKVDFADKIISFIYSHIIKFERINKMKIH